MKQRARGITLIELMVALTIGSVLIAGAVLVYSQSRNTYTVNETVARLQENARYIMSIIETDVQLAGHFGFSNVPDYISYISGGSVSSLLPAARMRKESTAVAAIDHECENNFVVDVISTVQGSDNTFPLKCAAQGGGALENTDTLTIRRTSSRPVEPRAGQVQLLASRLSPVSQYLFADGQLPSTPARKQGWVELRDLVVRTYYVSRSSDADNNVPALRVKALSGVKLDERPAEGSGEVLSGVEDLQVQFGVDTGDYDGNGEIDPGRDFNEDGIPDSPNGIATRYVNPADLKPGHQVVSVRVWLLLRALQPEPGYRDTQTYTYANKQIPARNDAFRRLLVSRTIHLRNARQL
jgi:type IV pilus assembly protein PilW